jgi:hypothetical protein
MPVIEIRAAFDAGVTLIPVLIGGAAMPKADELPSQLTELTLRNAVRLTHDNFKTDVEPLIGSLYEYLGFVPQTPYERFMESLPLSWGAKWNDKMRD